MAVSKIEFPRGDSYMKGVVLKKSGEPDTDLYDDVYFTVKTSYEDKNYIIQKRMSTGGITYDGNGHYTLYIDPEDTNGMKFGYYDFDFEFVKLEGAYKKTFPGRLRLTKEVTYASNE